MNLSPTELTRLQSSDPELEELRVHPSKKVWVTFPEKPKADSVDVTSDRVMISGQRTLDTKEIPRSVTGKIVGIDTLNSMPLFWVTFFPDCKDPSCAYGFVLTEYSLYTLVALPTLELHDKARAYRRTRTRRNRLKLSKQRSLAEINDVYAVSRRKGRRVLTIDLQFSKKTLKRTRRRRERAPGV